jgi:hypothetical protein
MNPAERLSRIAAMSSPAKVAWPSIDPAQFLQASVMSEVLERKQTSLVFEISRAHNRLKFRLCFSRKWRKARNCHAGNALST